MGQFSPESFVLLLTGRSICLDAEKGLMVHHRKFDRPVNDRCIEIILKF